MIRIEHLVKNYGSNCALDDVSFSVSQGEIVGLLGPNGAGKSTAMNILTGYLSSTSGKAMIDGVDILSDPLRAKKMIGYLPEQPPLYPDMTVWEYLSFCYDLKGCRGDRAAHLREICDTVRLSDVSGRLIRHLSKGYRQRVGIAQAMVGDPKVIIFDEPTVGLDPKQIIEVRNLIRGLGKTHTVILSTHLLSEVQAVCDRIVIINKGRIVADEKTERIANAVSESRRFRAKICGPQELVLQALLEMPGVARAELLPERDGDASVYALETEQGLDIRKKLFYLLSERGWALVGLESSGVNLEDIFLSVVNSSDQSGTKRAPRSARKTRRGKATEEETLGEALYEDADRRRKESAAQKNDED
ncbi:MAG: ATP-binding cassette domain-containing protein [Ruminococcaceae bacterium]|nr:ATP-binding cassette domain-containing protein [Oscillospiraceae bacterium]